MSEIKVNSIKGVAASTAALTINNTDGTCTANITNRTNKNLVLNGACLIAQRGTSSTTSGDYTVDRFRPQWGNTDENATMAQVDVASGTTPYTSGFRKALRITNGNQTSGAGTSDYLFIRYKIEAQDMANSGWNYVSASSYITLSFWVKSSVAQTFNSRLETQDGTALNYPFQYTISSADTWTKITKTIQGNSNLSFNNDNGTGVEIHWDMFRGTDYSDNSVSNDVWAAYSGSARSKDQTSTFYTTNDATFEITGVQLEVGSVATDFEHRSFAQELRLCQRYFQKSFDATVTPAASVSKCIYMFTRPYTSGYHEALGNDYIVEMRSQPSATFYPVQGSGSAGQISYYNGGWGNTSASYHTSHSNNKRLVFSINTDSSTTLIQYNYTLSSEL